MNVARVRVVAVVYVAFATLLVWLSGAWGGTTLQVVTATLVVLGAVALAGLLLVRQVAIVKTAVARMERTDDRERERLLELLRALQEQQAEGLSGLTKGTGRVGRAVQVVDKRIAKLETARTNQEAAHTQSLREVRSGIDAGMAGLVKSMGTLGRQMKRLETGLTATQDRLASGEASTELSDRQLRDQIAALTRSSTELSIRTEALFATVRRNAGLNEADDVNAGGRR